MSDLARACTHKISDSDLFNVRFSNRPSGSSTFRLSATPLSMSLTGSRFSSDSAPRPFHHGIRRRGGTIFGAKARIYMRQPVQL